MKTSVSLVLCVLGALCASPACTRAAPAPLVAQTSGELAVGGLSAPVRVVRDRWGVPHIYAQARDDLFFAQGFVQAQDRLFQMDLWRRSSQGRLSQVLGLNFIERDAMTRRVQYRGDPDAEWASYGPDAKAIATAFVRGVNAWVALARERPPEEFALAGWTPEFWMPNDLLNRTDLFVASRGTLDAGQWASAGPRAAEVIADALRRVGAPPFFVGLAADVRGAPRNADVSDPSAEYLHATRLDHPSRHYLVHLHAPGWNAIGATLPWLPGIAVGHDDRLPWNAVRTQHDLPGPDPPAIEVARVNPGDPHQVADNGRWVNTVVVADAVIVKGTKPFVYESEYTPRGVIVATDRERHLVFALRWRGTEAGALPALHALAEDRASRFAWRGPVNEPELAKERSTSVIFVHPLGIGRDARGRFNVGPRLKPTAGIGPFRLSPGSDWDQWTAMNAPGQSESPDSAHFKDLADEWAAGRSIPLAFSDRAVEAAAESTLTLRPSVKG